MPTIKIDERYSVSTDQYNWVITETYKGKDGNGNPKDHTRDHFFPRLSWCIYWLLQNNCKDVDSLEGIQKELATAEMVCLKVLNEIKKV
jgi:hypothetical protein